nr:MAG TPA: hypothetical protein [Caudoviricetes sp.]
MYFFLPNLIFIYLSSYLYNYILTRSSVYVNR